MTFYSAAPPSRTAVDNKPTLLVCWWCTSFAATTILFRVSGRYIRSEKLFKEDWLSFACLIPLFVRMALVHLVLSYGTNNMQTEGVDEAILQQRVIGSRLVLGSRIFYAATLWLLKLTISEFFKRLTPLHLWKPSYEYTFQFIRWFLLASFIGVVIADLAECHPVTHYWQVVPDPGPQCRQGFVQLVTMGVANVLTDLLLIIFPIPIIITSQMSIRRKLQLTGLFALSIVPIVTTLVRIPNIIERQGSQNYRSLWASMEILAATGVANALVLGSFVRDRGVKKLKYKFGSTSDSIERTTSRRGTVQRHWGSDEDLVRDLGLGVDPELRGNDSAPPPRKAPQAVGANHTTRLNENWRFPSPRDDADSEESDMVKFMVEPPPHSPGEISFVSTPRKVSFFDVGGLLDAETTPTTPDPHRGIAPDEGPQLAPTLSQDSSLHYAQHAHSQSLSPPAGNGPFKGSKALLQDLGGLLHQSPSSPNGGGGGRPSRPFRQVAMELQSFTPRQQRDRDQSAAASPRGWNSPTQPHNVLPMARPSMGGRIPSAVSLQDVGGLLK